MKPMTKLQHRVMELNYSLPVIRQSYIERSKTLFKKEGYRQVKAGIACTECGHQFHMAGVKVKCPGCNTTLKVEKTQRTKDDHFLFFSCFQRVKEFQVVRYVCMHRFIERGKAAKYTAREVCQAWISESGRETIVSIAKNYGSYYYATDGYVIGGDMEVRKNRLRYVPSVKAIFTSKSILPKLKKHGFNGNPRDFEPAFLFRTLLSSNKMETIWKTGLYELFYAVDRFDEDKLNKYWPQIRLLIRYKVDMKYDDIRDWVDYINLLEMFGRDTRNPTLVCTPNFKAEHDRYVEKRRQIRRKEKRKELEERIFELDAVYQKEKSRFMDIQIKSKDIVVAPLSSVWEFMNEGDYLKHCVFENEYYANDNALILSARIDGKPIETIQISLSKFKVVQSQGLLNKPTAYHNDIIELVNKNIKLFKQAYVQK